MTETKNALSLITKAGAASNKVVVGVSSYGRSFQMTTPGCTGPMCTYTGPASGATPGKCTQTAGYIANSEIRDILAKNPSAKTTYDSASQSDILVYDSTQWVAYMSDDNKKARQQQYKSLNVSTASVFYLTPLLQHSCILETSCSSHNLVYEAPWGTFNLLLCPCPQYWWSPLLIVGFKLVSRHN